MIKYVLSDRIYQLVTSGYNWLITGAQLGIEQWSVAVACRLRHDHKLKFKVAVMLPFTDFGNRWNSSNRLKMAKTIHRSDFSRPVSNSVYRSPAQFRRYQAFMLKHTDGALLIYDPDYSGQAKYDYRAIQKYRQFHRYPLDLIDADDLQEMANEYEEIYRERHHRGLN